ncbi:VOC family protein [Flexilinea flocculi]|uniref:Catechol 2,3-dioxygenase n=1 Tax=Flexilinea flocculi TaxID=1678840 RepID=A0A0S7BRA7_9CHLR|nr:VOC family protein [Flexilinea flocculi]GAP40971.1 catechol 2,3-dioxygenase [Flexilinea flocculi]
MLYKGTLIAVTDMERSKKFYHDVLNMNVVNDFGANVELEHGLYLQEKETWVKFINNKAVHFQHNAGELYFEEQDMDSFLKKLEETAVAYVHQPLEHPWGQRTVRFYDPDQHIIEVGEEIRGVVKRFLNRGMSVEQVAAYMDVPVCYVQDCLQG